MLDRSFILNVGCLAVICASIPVGNANAQTAPHMLRPIDQGTEDRGPLSASLRSLDSGLRQPTGFQDLYRVPGREGLLMRMDGALMAVFPESVYGRGGAEGGGPVPLIPAGTVFHIGTPTQLPKMLQRVSPSRIITERALVQTGLLAAVDTEVRRRSQWMIDDAGVWQNVPALIESRQSIIDDGRSSGPPIVNDEAYRTSRLTGLLHRAAEAYAGRQEEAVGNGQ